MSLLRVYPLICHPASSSNGVHRLAVGVLPEPDGGVSFHFRLEADPGRVVLPAPAEGFADGLWQHTCCEVFLTREGHSHYREFNFSPSGQWAAYAFADTRQRDVSAEADGSVRPEMHWTTSARGFELHARLSPSHLPAGPGALQVGLSAVLECLIDKVADNLIDDLADDGSGAKTARPACAHCTYWALNHPSPQPDFHHRDAFALTLEAPLFP